MGWSTWRFFQRGVRIKQSWNECLQTLSKASTVLNTNNCVFPALGWMVNYFSTGQKRD